MDVDEVEVEVEVTPAPDSQTHLLLAAQFQPFPFTHNARNALLARRSLMSNELLFDHLLDKAAIAASQSLFPPDSPDSLIDLLDAIAKCSWDSLKKSCLYFYLLSYVSSDTAAEYAATWAIPPQFVHLAHACFFLDSGTPDHLAHAVTLLSDTRIIPDLSSKVLHTLSLAPQPESSRLVRAYVRAVQPVLEDYDDLAIYVRALLECSLADAWTFQRTFSETTPLRNQLFRTILDACLIPPKPSVLPHLLSLPLTTFEFSILQSYALSPPDELTPSSHSILQDLITVRLLHSGKYSDAIRLSRAFDTLNAKSYAGNTTLNSAAADRQQMMRDVLAVVPDVQSRQLELEFNDEQADGLGLGEAGGTMGSSWASVGSDVTMSWETLGTSGSTRQREPSRSGRLEGSPAVKLQGRAPSAPNTPFGLFASPGSSAQKSKIRTESANIFGTPNTVRPIAPVLPTIPTPGLDASLSSGAPPPTTLTLQGLSFRPPARQSLGTSISATWGIQSQSQIGGQNGIVHASASAGTGTGHGARNGLRESEPLRAGDVFSTTRMRQKNGDYNGRTSNERSATDMTMEGNAREQDPTEDVTMVDSDDPDGFVVRGHGRRRTSLFRASLPSSRAHNNDDDKHDDEGGDGGGGGGDLGAVAANGVHVNGNGATTLFGREDAVLRSGSGTRQRHSSPQPRDFPGAYVSFDRNEGASEPARPATAAATQQGSHDQPKGPFLRSGHHHTRTRFTNTAAPSQPDTQPLKIPGALFDDTDAQPEPQLQPQPDEAAEQQDTVPSLPSVSSKPGVGRRTRASRAGSAATESGDEDDVPPKSLRRSSRLSSAGLSSPEPSSPPKQSASKRSSRASVPEGTGKSTRRRKNAKNG